MRVFSLDEDFRYASNSFFSEARSSCSVFIDISSSFANCLRRISKIALACRSESLNFFIKVFFGSSSFLMIFIISSRFRYATKRPFKMCSLSSTQSSLCCIRLFTVSVLNLIHSFRIPLRSNTLGLPSRPIAFMFTRVFFCSSVVANK